MRISQVHVKHFRRFTDLTISGLSTSTRLVILAGPNGSGKSSLFDAFNLWYQINSNSGWSGDKSYYAKSDDTTLNYNNRVELNFFSGSEGNRKGSFYFRSAYRNDPEFSLSSLNRSPPITEDFRFRKMIEGDATVSSNYQRLAAQAFEDAFAIAPAAMTIGQFREKTIGDIRDSVRRLLPDLGLNSLGNPMQDGTFRFQKGTSSNFEYKNLSGGEKAAFDLILDIVVKRNAFSDAVYCIDEPEAHMNTRLQGGLLRELFGLIPEESQLWVATHSIGMMKEARELSRQHQDQVAFLDFGDHDFDGLVSIAPSKPTRAFWEKALRVALDDLAELVAPEQIVVCEGNPVGAIPGKNAEHDAICYDTIFSDEFPDVKFLSGGNSHEVATDRLGFVAAFPIVARGIQVRRLIDRDDHSPVDVAKFNVDNIRVLSRRHLECYLFDDEVLQQLCASVGKPELLGDVIAEKQAAMAASVTTGHPADDVKSSAGVIYAKTKQILGLTGVGNDKNSFARNTLAPLLKPGMATYEELKAAIFAP